MTTRPAAGEYAPYYQKYIDLVPDGDIVRLLSSQIERTLALVRNVSEKKGDESYAPGKWTVKEVIGHVMDTERVFAYRALCIGRNDKTPLPGFEENDYVANASFNVRTLVSLSEELSVVRSAGVHLFKHFTNSSEVH